MKKTLLALLLVLTLCLPFFVGCDTTEPEVTEKPSGDAAENDTAGETSGVGSVESGEETQNYDEMFNDPYEVYVTLTERGYTGTFEEWVASLAGKDGADGKSAYELAVEKGYTGTVEEWLLSLIGAPGRGIESIEIVKGEFVVTYTDGTVVNLGALAENEGTEGLEYYPLPDGTFGVKMGTTQYLEEVVIPETYKGVAVTQILDEAFKNATNLKSITIPDSVTSIGYGAFYGCTSLTSVYITDITKWCAISFDSYDANPLYYAHNLYLNGELVTGLVIPKGVTSIGDSAFRGCTSLTSVVIPDSVTSIGRSAFSDCTNLESVFYTGSEEDWSKIAIGSNNSPLTSATIIYNYVPDGE